MDDSFSAKLTGGTTLVGIGGVEVIMPDGPGLIACEKVYMWPNGYVTVYAGDDDEEFAIFPPASVVMIISKKSWEKSQAKASEMLGGAMTRFFGLNQS